MIRISTIVVVVVVVFIVNGIQFDLYFVNSSSNIK